MYHFAWTLIRGWLDSHWNFLMLYTTQQRNLWFWIYPEDIWKWNSKGKLRKYIFIAKKRSIKRENKVSMLSIPQNIATQWEEQSRRKVHMTSLLQLTGPFLPHSQVDRDFSNSRATESQVRGHGAVFWLVVKFSSGAGDSTCSPVHCGP